MHSPQWLLDHPAILCQYFLFGFVAAIIAGCVKHQRLELPRIEVEKGKNGKRIYLCPGFSGTAFLGGLLAAVVDGRPFTAVAIGIACSWCGRELIRPLVEAWVKRVFQTLPIDVTLTPPTPPAAAGKGSA